jgi:peptidoglycan hydrolase-like protein with peptidoglycan-binding domain
VGALPPSPPPPPAMPTEVRRASRLRSLEPITKTMRALAALSATIAALALTSSAGAAGDSNVAALQVALHAKTFYPGPIDGLLGAATTTAIRSLEQRAGLPSTGSLNERLRSALGEYGRTRLGSRVLAPGLSGWDVAQFQFLLAWRGFPSGPFNGNYTERTAAAVRRLQTSRGMGVDGIAGPATLAVVRRSPPASPIHLSAPVANPLTGFFGPRADRFHTGVDYAADAGTPVRAAAAGRVTFAGWHPAGWGFLVTIAHGRGGRTMSAHLSRIDVKVGTRVRAGQTIGAVGSSGNSTGPHLHFELRLRGAAIDPLSALH